jgi:hypothetical protein
MFVGFEGYLNGKLYVGIYTPNCEYGYVIKNNEIYLDSVYEKDYNVKHKENNDENLQSKPTKTK